MNLLITGTKYPSLWKGFKTQSICTHVEYIITLLQADSTCMLSSEKQTKNITTHYYLLPGKDQKYYKVMKSNNTQDGAKSETPTNLPSAKCAVPKPEKGLPFFFVLII